MAIVCVTSIICSNERMQYHLHREIARSAPDKYLTIIVDGMDQAKTNLPNTKLISKSTSSLWRLRTHVTGVILHSTRKIIHTYIDLIQYPHDSNLTITVIVRSLVEFIKSNFLPKVLYLQADNTCRENKNKYVLTFCAILVHLGIFDTVCAVLFCLCIYIT